MTEILTADGSPQSGADVNHGADPDLDRLNLDQALRDFEVANRRVLDLAHRLSSLHRELLDTRTELQLTKIQLQQSSRQVDRIRNSRFFPMVRVLAQARRIIRR